MPATAHRTPRLLHMDGAAWKEPVKDRASADGLDRARVVEALLDAYGRSLIDIKAPDGRTYGQKDREQCRAKVDDAVWEAAERRWQPSRTGGRSMSLLCELLLKEYAQGSILVSVTAESSDSGS